MSAARTQGREHRLAVVSSFLRPGRWVECSCGWASPDLQFHTDAEAIEWARTEHDQQTEVDGREWIISRTPGDVPNAVCTGPVVDMERVVPKSSLTAAKQRIKELEEGRP